MNIEFPPLAAVSLTEDQDFKEALSQIGRFLTNEYQSKHIHSSLAYLPQAEFEANQQQ